MTTAKPPARYGAIQGRACGRLRYTELHHDRGRDLVARAQKGKTPLIGFLDTGSPDTSAHLLAAFQRGLTETGYVEGRNINIDYRWAMGQYDRLPALVAELISHQVVLIATGAPPATLAAKAATSTTPIVFSIGGDPVRLGIVSSLNRPGGNITGATYFTTTLEAKRLELLRALLPPGALIGALMNQKFPSTQTQVNELEAGARTLGQRILVTYASNDREINDGFAAMVQQKVNGLLVGADPFFFSRREQVVALAKRHAIPAIYQIREFAVAGGLMSYGASIADAHRQKGIYAGRVLKGEKPADLPVVLPTKFEFVINRKIANELGLQIPDKTLSLADEVIE